MSESVPTNLAEWMDERINDAFSSMGLQCTHVVDKNVWSVMEQLLTVLQCPERYSSTGWRNQDIVVLPLSPELPQ